MATPRPVTSRASRCQPLGLCPRLSAGSSSCPSAGPWAECHPSRPCMARHCLAARCGDRNNCWAAAGCRMGCRARRHAASLRSRVAISGRITLSSAGQPPLARLRPAGPAPARRAAPSAAPLAGLRAEHPGSIALPGRKPSPHRAMPAVNPLFSFNESLSPAFFLPLLRHGRLGPPRCE